MTELRNNPALVVLDVVTEDINNVFDDDSDKVLFIRLWYSGEFDACREYWPNLPNDVYDGADPLFRKEEKC